MFYCRPLEEAEIVKCVCKYMGGMSQFQQSLSPY